MHAAAVRTVLDDFRDACARGARRPPTRCARSAARRRGDGSLCLDYDFAGVSGYAVLRARAAARLARSTSTCGCGSRAAAPCNDFQIKFVDASGDNVWWINRPGFALPGALTELQLRRRHVDFAWGPTTDRTLRQHAHHRVRDRGRADEGRAVAARCASRASSSRERAPDPSPWPEPRARARAAARSTSTSGMPREFNGVALRWPARRRAARLRRCWPPTTAAAGGVLRRVRGSDGGLDALFAARERGAPPARAARCAKRARAADARAARRRAVARLQRRARRAGARSTPRGDLPRAFLGEQNYWTLVGVDGGGERSALLSRRRRARGRARRLQRRARRAARRTAGRSTWADVRSRAVAARRLPAAARGALAARGLHARHRGRRRRPARRAASARALHAAQSPATGRARFTLLLAVRPWQVEPAAAVPDDARAARAPCARSAWADGVLAVERPAACGPRSRRTRGRAAPFDAGVWRSTSLRRRPAARARCTTRSRHASALLQFDVTLDAANAEAAIGWTAPLAQAGRSAVPPARPARRAHRPRPPRVGATRLNRVRADAAAGGASDRRHAAHAARAHADVARRPGAAAGHALLRPHVGARRRDDGRGAAAPGRDRCRARVRRLVRAATSSTPARCPAASTARGADPVAENDSHGQYLYAVAEVWRHTRDRALGSSATGRRCSASLSVPGGAAAERARRAQPRAGARAPVRPHAAVDQPRGLFRQAGVLVLGRLLGPARLQGRGRDRARARARRTEAAALVGVARRVRARARALDRRHRAHAPHRLRSPAPPTAAISTPRRPRWRWTRRRPRLPPALLAGDLRALLARVAARAPRASAPGRTTRPTSCATSARWCAWASAARAHAMLDFFFGRPPPGGLEPVGRGRACRARASARFLGDMPHAWVASDYIRSALDLFCLRARGRRQLVVGAGWKPAWLHRGSRCAACPPPTAGSTTGSHAATDGWRLAGARAARRTLRGLQPRVAGRRRRCRGRWSVAASCPGTLAPWRCRQRPARSP